MHPPESDLIYDWNRAGGHDTNGIFRPLPLAPFSVQLPGLDSRHEAVATLAAQTLG